MTDEEIAKAFRHKYYLNRKDKHAKSCAKYHKKNKKTISKYKKKWYQEKKLKQQAI